MSRQTRKIPTLADVARQSPDLRRIIKAAEHPCLCCRGEGKVMGRECPRCEGTGTDRAHGEDFYQPSF